MNRWSDSVEPPIERKIERKRDESALKLARTTEHQRNEYDSEPTATNQGDRY
jgi:hypothetical protein